MCLVGIWMSVSRLGRLRIATEYQGAPSHTGRHMTAKRGVVVIVDEARACRIALLISPGLNSGFAVHDPVSR
jgi:hypothetical protein